MPPCWCRPRDAVLLRSHVVCTHWAVCDCAGQLLLSLLVRLRLCKDHMRCRRDVGREAAMQVAGLRSGGLWHCTAFTSTCAICVMLVDACFSRCGAAAAACAASVTVLLSCLCSCMNGSLPRPLWAAAVIPGRRCWYTCWPWAVRPAVRRGGRSSCSAHHDTHRPIASSCRHAARDDSDHGRRNGRRCWHRWFFCTVVAGVEGVAVCVWAAERQ